MMLERGGDGRTSREGARRKEGSDSRGWRTVSTGILAGIFAAALLVIEEAAWRHEDGKLPSELVERENLGRGWTGIEGQRQSAESRLEALQRRLQRSAEELQGSDGSSGESISRMIVEHKRRDVSRHELNEKFRRWMNSAKNRDLLRRQQPPDAAPRSNHVRDWQMGGPQSKSSDHSRRSGYLTPYQARMLSDLFKKSSKLSNSNSASSSQSSSTTVLKSRKYKTAMPRPYARIEPAETVSLKELNASITRTLTESEAFLSHVNTDLVALQNFLRNVSLRVQRTEAKVSSTDPNEKQNELEMVESATAGAVKAVLAMLFSHAQASNVHGADIISTSFNATAKSLSLIPRSLAASAQSIGSSILKIMNVSVLGNQSKVEVTAGKAVLQELTTAFQRHQIVQRNDSKPTNSLQSSIKTTRHMKHGHVAFADCEYTFNPPTLEHQGIASSLSKEKSKSCTYARSLSGNLSQNHANTVCDWTLQHKPDAMAPNIPGVKYIERDYVLSHINGEPVLLTSALCDLQVWSSASSFRGQQLNSGAPNDEWEGAGDAESVRPQSPTGAGQEWLFSQDTRSHLNGQHSGFRPNDIRETVLKRENMENQRDMSAPPVSERKQPGYYGVTASIYESIDRMDRLLKASEDVAGFASSS
eukprot:768630-Hanusia_phi.AAC.2